ncbi:MAG TPA: DUF423 domain-containing protein [Flavobacteriia bacterium]|nr:DUF423 domain-containing protein [Flavobacteriia bacterium]
MNKNLSITAILGFLAVALGAFGAHTLKNKIGLEQLKVFETGVRYQMYHVLVLLFVNSYVGFSQKVKNKISLFFFLGILFFSGSLYLLSTQIIPAKFIGPITPIGGLFFITGWLTMSYHFVKNKK